MLTELVIFFAAATGLAALAALIPGAARAYAFVSLPLVAVLLVGAAAASTYIVGDPGGVVILLGLGLLVVLATRALLRRWSFLACASFGCAVAATLLYIAYSAVLGFTDPAGPIAWPGSLLLVLLEAAALGLSLSYAFEVFDVLGRRDQVVPMHDPNHRPAIAIQVPCYNEPVDILRSTLRSLAQLRYPDLLVQVVDNNTKDEGTWRPIQAECQRLGERFQFIHLENWPGYKAGALNEATRRLPERYQVIGVVDADYEVEPDWLEKVAGAFKDPEVAFVQSSQHYRDWKDDDYLRGLFYSYRYFFDVTMPARARRNAIIFAGTMGLVRRSALEAIGGWNEACVTEDAEASLRMLGHGHRGVYVRRPYGAGLMPLTFDGLKKQRFRWALGGMQILRRHWRELLPAWPGQRLRLSPAQRVHYLLGSVQWLGDLLTLGFTVLLLLTALAALFAHRLPVRQLLGAVVIVPAVFLLAGLLRALWGLRTATSCRWSDALRALAVWFALSWTVAYACARGLLGAKSPFLRTPKARTDGGFTTIARALLAARLEVVLAAVCVLAAVTLVLRAPSFGIYVLAALLAYQALLYGSSGWASLAAEGIRMTEFRRSYRISTAGSGEWPEARGPGQALPAIAIGAVAAVVLYLIVNAQQATVPAAPPAVVSHGHGAVRAVQAQPTPTAPPSTAQPSITPSPTKKP